MSNRITREFLESLTDEEIQIILDYIREKKKSAEQSPVVVPVSAVLVNTEDKTHTDVLRCPYCQGTFIRKNGSNTTKRGRVQKYYCHHCEKNFCETTGTILYRAKVTGEQIQGMIDNEISKMTLRDEAYYNEVSVTTAFRIRHLLHEAAGKVQSKEILSGLTEVDSTYTKINLAGTKPEKMPRISKKRGKGIPLVGKRLAGSSHHKICLVTAIDENDDMIFRIAGLGHESAEMYQKQIGYFGESVKVISDGCKSISKFAENNGYNLDAIRVRPGKKSFKTEEGNTLSTVNQLHQELAETISAKHGISTRHLQGELDWITYRKKMRYRYNRSLQMEHMYEELMHTGNPTIRDDQIKTKMPISLYHAYREYQYGIYAYGDPDGNVIENQLDC